MTSAATADLLVVSSSRKTGAIAYRALRLLRAATSRDDVLELVCAAYRFRKTLFWCTRAPTPTAATTGNCSALGSDSRFSFNLRDIRHETDAVRFDCFPLIDSDFA